MKRKINKENIGKTIYITNTYHKTIQEGVIIGIKEFDSLCGVKSSMYAVSISTENDGIKNMFLSEWQYKNNSRWHSTSFYFVREQAVKRLAELEALEQAQKERLTKTKRLYKELTIAEIIDKPEELLSNIIIDGAVDLVFNQSQLKQINENYFTLIKEIINNKDNVYFDSNYAFLLTREIINNKDNIYFDSNYDFGVEPFEHVNIDNITLIFNLNVFGNNVKSMGFRIRYKAYGYVLTINYKKWYKFFKYIDSIS